MKNKNKIKEKANINYYIKENGRYKTVDIFRGFPAEGLWLVQKNKYSTGSHLICKLHDLHNLHIPTLAALQTQSDIAVKALKEALDKGVSLCEIYNIMAEAISKGFTSVEDRCNDLVINQQW